MVNDIDNGSWIKDGLIVCAVFMIYLLILIATSTNVFSDVPSPPEHLNDNVLTYVDKPNNTKHTFILQKSKDNDISDFGVYFRELIEKNKKKPVPTEQY